MGYSPPAHTPFQWQNTPDTQTPLDATNLEAAENDLVSYIQQVADSVVSYIQSQLNTVVSPEIGTICLYAGQNDPPQTNGVSQWMIANGRALEISQYQALYDVIGNTYNTTAESGYFNLPNLQGMFPLGFNPSNPSYPFAAQGGQLGHTHQAPTANATIPAINIPELTSFNHSHELLPAHAFCNFATTYFGNLSSVLLAIDYSNGAGPSMPSQQNVYGWVMQTSQQQFSGSFNPNEALFLWEAAYDIFSPSESLATEIKQYNLKYMGVSGSTENSVVTTQPTTIDNVGNVTATPNGPTGPADPAYMVTNFIIRVL